MIENSVLSRRSLLRGAGALAARRRLALLYQSR